MSNQFKTATLPQSTINVAVSSIANAVEIGDVNAARQTADHIAGVIEGLGGFTWTNPYWYGCDMTPDVSTPTGRYGNRSFEYVKWPTAGISDIVDYDGKQYRVVANYTSPGKPGQWVCQFAFYAIMPV